MHVALASCHELIQFDTPILFGHPQCPHHLVLARAAILEAAEQAATASYKTDNLFAKTQESVLNEGNISHRLHS